MPGNNSSIYVKKGTLVLLMQIYKTKKIMEMRCGGKYI